MWGANGGTQVEEEAWGMKDESNREWGGCRG